MKKTEIVVALAPGSLASRRPDLADAADEYARASLSANSRKAIDADWKVFSEWCAANGFQAMPASVDAAAGFMADQARSKKVATLARYRATVGKLHKLRGHPSPFADARVKAVIEGIRRAKGVAQTRKAPMTIEIAASVERARDRAIALFGVATSFRGAELCALDVGDIQFVEEGAIVHLRRSKVDQAGAGRYVGVPRMADSSEICPVRALEGWLAQRGAVDGPLFCGFLSNGKLSGKRLSPETVNATVKAVARSAGLDAKEFGAHSLRAGYVTEARRAGLDWSSIMEQTGHKKLETVRRYDRGAIDPFRASRVADVFKKK